MTTITDPALEQAIHRVLRHGHTIDITTTYSTVSSMRPTILRLAIRRRTSGSAAPPRSIAAASFLISGSK